MQRLLRYIATLYDANCLILYCFFYELPRRDGSKFLVQEDDKFTPLVRAITQTLIDHGKHVKTLRVIMEEVSDPVLASAVHQRVNEADLRDRMGLAHLQPFPPDLELLILQKCKKTAKKLAAKSWFVVEDFQPERPMMDALVAFYRGVAADPSLSTRRSMHKNLIPSSQDRQLMVYSKRSGLPILTNDSDFTCFARELQTLNHVTEIVPLHSVKV